MFGLRPSAPTHPDDYAVHRAGRSLRNTRVRPRGLTRGGSRSWPAPIPAGCST